MKSLIRAAQAFFDNLCFAASSAVILDKGTVGGAIYDAFPSRNAPTNIVEAEPLT
jgi:hypothetical protein